MQNQTKYAEKLWCKQLKKKQQTTKTCISLEMELVLNG